MPNKDLLYKISSDVFSELGEGFDEAKAESLITRIYQTIEPFISAASSQDVSLLSSSNRVVVSVFGLDHSGIVARITEILASANCSIVDINQTVVNSKFAMVIIANTTDVSETVSNLKDIFGALAKELGVNIYIQREDLFNAMHRI
jgi:ACT domain-containing protein